MSFRNMLFREFVKTLEISVKSIFLEPEKFENIQKLSSTVKNLCKPQELRQHFIQKVLSDIGYQKYVRQGNFSLLTFVEGVSHKIFHYITSHESERAGNWKLETGYTNFQMTGN